MVRRVFSFPKRCHARLGNPATAPADSHVTNAPPSAVGGPPTAVSPPVTENAQSPALADAASS